MGMDAYADIYYGFPLNSLPWSYNEDTEEECDCEPEDKLAQILGITEPDVEWDEETRPLFEAYWNEKREAEKAQTCAITSSHCYDEPMYYVECKRAGVSASWEPRQFFPHTFGHETEMREEIRAFCELMGIEFQEPCWYLVAAYS